MAVGEVLRVSNMLDGFGSRTFQMQTRTGSFASKEEQPFDSLFDQMLEDRGQRSSREEQRKELENFDL